MLRGLMSSGVLLLAATSGADATEPHIGRWSIDPVGCTVLGDTSSTAPMFVTKTTVKWFVADCKIGRMYKVGHAMHIQARCSNEGKIVSTPITLEARGDRLRVTWDGVKVEDMRRCK
jgi:hypothetical protein